MSAFAEIGGRMLRLERGDITRVAVDAIVNAANSSLMGGGGVDGAIHAAGGPAILAECRRVVEEYGPLPAGKAVVTTAGDLPARYVIHTVGPIWRGGGAGEAGVLESAYRESLRVAEAHGVASVAFPSIATGAYAYPLASAAGIAIATVAAFLAQEARSVSDVAFVLFDAHTYAAYAAALDALR